MPGRLVKLPGIAGRQSPAEIFEQAESARLVAKGFIFRGVWKRAAGILAGSKQLPGPIMQGEAHIGMES